MSRETQMSIAASSMFPGFRFSPTDTELISYYLKKKIEGLENCVGVISEIEICKYEPWDLPAKSIIKSESEWFFFCTRGRKYPNGSQSRRATEMGYWKATGKERNVKSGSSIIGTKRTLVFHVGRAPKGERTEWILHEYCMKGNSQEYDMGLTRKLWPELITSINLPFFIANLKDSPVVCRLRRNSEFRQNSSSNQASASLTQLSPLHPSSYAISEGNTDQTGNSEGDKILEWFSKKCSSSYDSHSTEQIDSASESERKHLNEVTASCSHPKESDDEDWYAEILKDDIIKLDESSLLTPAPPPVVASKYEPEKKYEVAVGAVASTAVAYSNENTMLKFRKPAEVVSHAEAPDDEKSKSKSKSKSTSKPSILDKPPFCLISILSGGRVKRLQLYVVFVVVSLLALILILSSRKLGAGAGDHVRFL
uniref:NAC39 n=2 Tax=Carica papaya TaxID=3649 RepID=A0A1D6YZC7_CARPA|nr:NAC39 [Carica papaya]